MCTEIRFMFASNQVRSLNHATLVINLNGIIRKINQIKRLISVVTNEKKEQVATKYMVNQITCWNSQW